MDYRLLLKQSFLKLIYPFTYLRYILTVHIVKVHPRVTVSNVRFEVLSVILQ